MEQIWERVGPRRAWSPGGYCVTIRGLEGVEYQEGDIILRPQSEALWGDAGFGLSARSIEGSAERRAEVIERIRAGLEFMGQKLQVDDDV